MPGSKSNSRGRRSRTPRVAAIDRLRCALRREAAGMRSARCSPTTSGSMTVGRVLRRESNGRAAAVAEVTGDRRRRASNRIISKPVATSRAIASVLSYSLASRPATSQPTRSTSSCSRSSRSTPTDRIVGRSYVRPRRSRRRHRGARRPVPRRRGGSPRTHLVGHRGGLRRIQPARAPPTTPEWVSIDHRAEPRFAPGDMTAYLNAAWDRLA